IGDAQVSLLGLQLSDIVRWRFGATDTTTADFVLRNFRNRILRRDRELIRTFLSGPVVRDKDRVRADGGDDHRLEGDRAATGFGGGPIVVLDAELFREARVDLDSRLRVLIDQRADASGLRAGEKLADDSAGRQEDRVFGADVVHRSAVVRDVEAGLAIREVKWPRALGNGIVAVALEEPWSSGMIGNGLSCLVIVRRARPEHSELFLDFLISDSRVIRDTALAGNAQLFEYFRRRVERKSVRPIQRLGDVLDDDPILSRFTGTVDRFVDLDHAPFHLRYGAFVLFLQAAGKDDVGMSRGVVQEEIDRDIE